MIKPLFFRSLIVCGFALSLLLPSALHAETKRNKVPQIERLVLMPLLVEDQDRHLQDALEVALTQGLQARYVVFSGTQVVQKAREIFDHESRTAVNDCDETRCMENIAIAFQAELLANARVTRVEQGFLLTLSIRNVFDNKTVFSNSLPCERCNTFELVSRVKELSQSGRPQSSTGTGLQTSVFIENIEVQPANAAPYPNASAQPEEALWHEVKNSMHADELQIYLRQYPKGKFASQAKKRLKQLQEVADRDAQQQELALWNAAEKSAAEVDYQRYLAAFPQGTYAGLAQIRLRKIAPAAAVVDPAEAAQWQAASTSTSIAEVQAYLDRYPNGQYVAEAKNRIKKLQKDAPMQSAPKESSVTPAPESRSAADRLHEAEAAGRQQEQDSRRVLVLPKILKQLNPADREMQWVLPIPLPMRTDSDSH